MPIISHTPWLLHWAARIVSLAYLAFFLFMLIAHLLPGGEPFGQLTGRESLAFAVVGVYFLGTVIGWRFALMGGLLSLAATVVFALVAAAKLQLILWMLIPGVLYLVAAGLSTVIQPDRAVDRSGDIRHGRSIR